MVGFVVSVTVIVKDFDPVFPLESVAEQITVLVPTGKVVPEVGLQLTGIAPSTLSTALALNVITAPEELVASLVMSDGTVIVGGEVSGVPIFTIIVTELVVVLPLLSNAVAEIT